MREAAGLTQQELANRVGVAESTIRHWERSGVGFQGFVRAALVCEALGCSAEDLIIEVEEDSEDSE
jgi:transcriptional regulator with XRE-family HTH domain